MTDKRRPGEVGYPADARAAVKAGLLTREERVELVALHRLLLRTVERARWFKPPFEEGNEVGPRFEEGNEAGARTAKHGAYSERQWRPLAEAWQERLDGVMREAGVHDRLDDVARERLARSLARMDLVEETLDECNGWFDERGEVTPAYMLLIRQERAVLAHLRELGLTMKSRSEIRLATAQTEHAISAAEVQALVAAMLRAPDAALVEALAGLVEEELARQVVRAFRPLYLRRMDEAAAGVLSIEAAAVDEEDDVPPEGAVDG